MKKTKTKKLKGGIVAFLAAGVLMTSVVPARANDGWEGLLPILPVLYEVVKDIIVNDGGGSGGTEKVPCWSAGFGEEGNYVNCASCTVLPGHYDGPKAKCSRRY